MLHRSSGAEQGILVTGWRMTRVWRAAAVSALLLVSAALRLPLLDRRPMHADEAILADKLGTLLSTGTYPYDPHEYHGPVLAYLAWIPAHLTGHTTYALLTETTLRTAPAIAGILLALSPLLLAPAIGSTAAFVSAAIAAVSPALVYYSRDFIPEIPLALWTALFLAALSRPETQWRLLAGAAAGLMIATKETAWLALASTAIAYAVTVRSRPGWRNTVALTAVAAAVASLLLAPPWKWGVLAEAVVAYARKGAENTMHIHPWYSYFAWIAGWHYSLSEAPVLILAVAGVLVARRPQAPFVQFLAVYSITLAAVYSAVPYKTPWCAVSILYALALLAGISIAALASRRPAVAMLMAAAVVGSLAWQAWLGSVPHAADPRNPWVYAQSGAGAFAIRDRIEEFARAAPEGDSVSIDVYTTENFWPLPWYFRPYPNVRWFRRVPVPGRAGPIVLLSPDCEPELVRKLYEGPPPGERELYVNLFPAYVELRPQVEVRGYVAKSLWDRWERSR
jgi:uncharacterized protein (TIGR03663 family)